MITNSSHNSVPYNKQRPSVNIRVTTSIYINLLLSFTLYVQRLRTTMHISITYVRLFATELGTHWVDFREISYR